MSSVELFSRIDNLVTGITTALALGAIIFGGIGLGGRPKPRGSAGAGLALGASSLLATLFALIVPFLVSASSGL